VLERAHQTGRPLPDEARAWFASLRVPEVQGDTSMKFPFASILIAALSAAAVAQTSRRTSRRRQAGRQAGSPG
jgi:DNA invertase Pin-like site-specific DNA recombinase